MRGLIVGFGRAGQRHAKMLDELGIKWHVTEPNKALIDRPFTVVFPDLEAALTEGRVIHDLTFDFAVICTPPDLHLEQIKRCLDAGLPVLCEKPLCGLGQLEEAESLLAHPNAHKLMTAYNYRYLPSLTQARGKPPKWMTCWQDRELPQWGLLLDHVSHDLDILRFLCGDIAIKSARYYPAGSFLHDGRRQMWEIKVTVPGLPEWEEGVIRLRESVGSYEERKAKLEYEDGTELDIEPNPVMFKEMWDSFLRGEYSPGLGEAIEIQRLLEECWRMANES